MRSFASLCAGVSALALSGAALAQSSTTQPLKNGNLTLFNAAGQQDASGNFHYRDVMEGLNGTTPVAVTVGSDSGLWTHVVNWPASFGISSVASGAYADCAITTIGCESDAAWSGTGSATLMAAVKKLDADVQTLNTSVNSPIPANSKVGIDQTTPGTTNAVQPIVGATGGATHYHLANGSTTGTPALNTIKGSAGTLLTLVAENATGTVEYLHVYDAVSPTCGSATGLAHVYMVPTNTSGAGFVIPIPVGGEAYSSAITYFITGGEADTDCTAAVAGVLVEGSFK
jgi:hypothetical protein